MSHASTLSRADAANDLHARIAAFLEHHSGLLIAVALHVVAVIALLQSEAVRQQLLEAVPLMVNVIELPKPVEPPKPKPVAEKPVQKVTPQQAPLPVIASTTTAPGPVIAEQHKVEALPPIEAKPVAIAPPEPPKPAPVVPPNFSANYLNNPPPEYPSVSRKYREAGKVLLHVQVSASGTALRVDIQTSSGFARLDQAAQQAAKSWRFVPAKQGTEAVVAWVLVPIEFTLE